MKDINSIKLPKYSGESYEPIAFGVYHNKKSRNYCICLTADDMNEFIMEALLSQYSLGCAEYCGEEKVIDEKSFMGMGKGKQMISCIRGYVR